MAAAVGRLCKPGILQPKNGNYLKQVKHLSTSTWSSSRRNLLAAIGALAGGAGALVYALDLSVKASDLVVHPAHLPWTHNKIFNTYDHASVRRGYEVYKQVCSACHGMKYLAFRKLVNVCFDEEGAKAEAAEYEIRDGPNAEGNYFNRPRILSDTFPDPYPNEEAARVANNGALPPDLSLISSARHGKDSYIFHLLTSYFDPPAGHVVGEGQYYNPYFPGGNISMAKALYDEVIEYEDGTPATTSQLAKDVATFLRWSAEPDMSTRKYYFIKILLFLPVVAAITWYYKRFLWTTLKTRKIVFVKPSKRLK